MTSDPVPDTLMAYLDGELPAEEAEAFRQLLEKHPEWREEAARMGALVEATDRLAFRPPPVETWDGYWEEIDSRISKRTGWLLSAIGGALLCGWGTWKILTYAENPLVRVGLALLLVGMLLLFFSVLRGHLLERPNDRYRKVRR